MLFFAPKMNSKGEFKLLITDPDEKKSIYLQIDTGGQISGYFRYESVGFETPHYVYSNIPACDPITWPINIPGLHNILSIAEMEHSIDHIDDFMTNIIIQMVACVSEAREPKDFEVYHKMSNLFDTIPEFLMFCKRYIIFRNEETSKLGVNRYMNTTEKRREDD